MNRKNNYIWLFGENLGNTANNNSFYLWKYIVNNKKANINKYLILSKNEDNKQLYKTLNQKEQKSIVWRNSLKHLILYKYADMAFVTLSYKDVKPDIYYKNKNKVPIIYLQHGVLAIKKLGYKGNSYNNDMLRFLYYNKNIEKDLKEKNDFRNYQLYYGKYQPRWQELVRRYNKKILENENEIHKITWFLTWREYLGSNVETKLLIRKIRMVLKDERLRKYLEENNIKLEVVFHQFFADRKNEIMRGINNKNVTLVNQKEIDVMQAIVDTDLLITDYSSIGFDATLINKPVILFFPDIDDYLAKRETYCSIEELKESGFSCIDDLINNIINRDYGINKFYRSRLPDKIELDKIEKGRHLERIYKYFNKLQKNKITFIGYNFYGVGGSVSATRSLAEGLLEKGYMVSLLSLKKVGDAKKPPYALNMKALYDSNSNKLKDRIKKSKIIWRKSNFKYLKNDPSKDYMTPYVGYALQKKLHNMRSNTVISTRESMHHFLIDATSNKIKNKIYFYHCSADCMEELFPGVIEDLQKYRIDKAVFVTEKNRKEMEEKCKYNNYNKFLISGNTIERKDCRNINKIEATEIKPIYKGIYLLRISREREKDLDRLIEFGKYLVIHNINNIIIDVFGDGDYVDKFLDKLEKEKVIDVIHYRGKTKNPTHHIRHHDVLVDFSLNQSFGMTYIEGILNGKMVYCMRNTGSEEVLKDIDGVFIESNEDLVNKINNLPNISKETLQSNYRKIENRFSRKKVAGKFIEFIEN